MTVAKGGAASGYGGRHPGLMHANHVGITLDDHCRMIFIHMPARPIEPKQDLSLVIDNRVGGVHILGVRVVGVIARNLIHLASTKADRVAA